MNCPICNFKSDIRIQNAKSYYSTVDFNIRECKECELLFTETTNREVEIKNIYKNVYDYSVHDCTKNEKLWRIKNTYKKVSNKLNLDSNSNVLDIGCMQGFFLNFLKKKYSCKVLGIETEDYYLKKKINKLNIIKTELTEFSQNEKNHYKFDLIIMSHSFEHFADPINLLNCIKKLLTKNGKCLIVVPNINSNFSNLSKSFWGWLQPAAHFFHYSTKSLSKIFHKSNFKYKIVSKNGGDSLLLALTILNVLRFNYKGSSKFRSNRLRNMFISFFSAVFKYIYYFGNDEIVFIIEK
jgi:2-polyprenyl-3-methyl-5-hydroxy-6-metoxy-1,4-benzoquinol methylase